MGKSPAQLDREIATIVAQHARISPKSRLLQELDQLAEQHSDFLYGRCATLAIALHRLTGKPIYGLVGTDEDTGESVLVHAYIKLDADTRVDIKGPRALDEILADFLEDEATADADELPLTEREVAKLATGSTRCPSLQTATALARTVWKITQQLLAAG